MRVRRLALAVILIGAALYFLAPLWWLFVAASRSLGNQSGTGWWFSGFHLFANLKALVDEQNGVFLHWVANSLLYSGVGAAGATLLSAMAGYALAKYRFRFREALFTAILAAVLVPKMLLATPLYLLFSAVHLTGNRLAFFLPSLVSPFGVYLCRIFAAGAVPDEIIEAARMDGAGELAIFFRIAVRMMTPALVTVFLFNVVDIWNNYLLPTLVLKDSQWPVTVGLGNWFSTKGAVELSNYVIIGAFASLIPLAAVFVFFQRYWRTDLTAGAVK
ncbi:MAG: carbohydrate ABC transporter permease [Solirubrobacterales bacterium]|nr:carbohydrate ABC transporter permease [Solirubrobacterales bacterium]